MIDVQRCAVEVLELTAECRLEAQLTMAFGNFESKMPDFNAKPGLVDSGMDKSVNMEAGTPAPHTVCVGGLTVSSCSHCVCEALSLCTHN